MGGSSSTQSKPDVPLMMYSSISSLFRPVWCRPQHCSLSFAEETWPYHWIFQPEGSELTSEVLHACSLRLAELEGSEAICEMLSELIRLKKHSLRPARQGPGLLQSFIQHEEPDVEPVKRSSSFQWLPPDNDLELLKRSSSSYGSPPPTNPDVEPVKRSSSFEWLPPDNDLELLKRSSSSYGSPPPTNPDVEPVKRSSRRFEWLPPDNDLELLKRSSSYGLLPPHMA